MTPPRALIVTGMLDWVGLSRLPSALGRHGFQISVICPAKSLVSFARPIHHLAAYASKISQQTFWNSVMREIDRFRPDILIPGDDLVVRLLHALHQTIRNDSKHTFAKDLLERSLGDPAKYPDIERKSGLIEMSRQTSVPIPESCLLNSEHDAIEFAKRIGYPIILKPDFGSGGVGIVKCDDEKQLREGYSQSFKRNQPILAQRFVNGPTTTVNFVAEKGGLIGCFSLLRETTYPNQFGIAAMVRLIDNPKMLEMTAMANKYFGYSGFGSTQFLIDEQTGEPLFMELNIRPTPFTYMGEIFGADLVGGLRSMLTKESPPPTSPPLQSRVAIFPNEWLRDPNSPSLHDPAVYHDVPWNEPQLLTAIIRQWVKV